MKLPKAMAAVTLVTLILSSPTLGEDYRYMTTNGTITITRYLPNPAWLPLSTNTLVDGSCYFTDAGWPNYPARFYRVRAQ